MQASLAFRRPSSPIAPPNSNSFTASPPSSPTPSLPPWSPSSHQSDPDDDDLNNETSNTHEDGTTYTNNLLPTYPFHSHFNQQPYIIQPPECPLTSAAWSSLLTSASQSLHAPTLNRTPTIDIPHPRTDIKTATWNINGLNTIKFTAVCWLFAALKIDVLVLTDTRQLTTESSFFTRQASKLLPAGTQVRHSSLSPHQKGHRIGGQLILISNKWSDSIINFWSDDSNFGLVTTLTLRCAQQDLMIIGSYWPVLPHPPTSNTAVGGLWTRAATWLANSRPFDKSTPYSTSKTPSSPKPTSTPVNQPTQYC